MVKQRNHEYSSQGEDLSLVRITTAVNSLGLINSAIEDSVGFEGYGTITSANNQNNAPENQIYSSMNNPEDFDQLASQKSEDLV